MESQEHGQETVVDISRWLHLDQPYNSSDDEYDDDHDL